MGLENPTHIAILVVVLLVIFGAKRLPEIGKSLGEGMRGFKDSISGNSPPESLTPPPPPPPPASAAAQAATEQPPTPTPAPDPR